MTETPETPSLADRLDRFRLAVMADGERSLIMNPPVSDDDRTAAAVRLRKLDRIEAALRVAALSKPGGVRTLVARLDHTRADLTGYGRLDDAQRHRAQNAVIAASYVVGMLADALEADDA